MGCLLQVLGYLLATKDKRVVFRKEAGLTLEAYSDASFEEWGATAGFVLLLAGAQVMCVTKRERCVAISTCEAEFVAASMCAAAISYIRLLLEEMGYEQTKPTRLYVDNKAAN